MEAMVDDQGTVVVSQSTNNSASTIETVVSSSQSSESSHANQIVTATAGQTITVPTLGGQVSIVHVALPNQQPVQVQSVIQPNQQSVIQTTSGTSTLQAVQLAKGNVILLNKGGGSVIQTATGQQLQAVQIMSEEEQNAIIAEEDSKKRREILARRPSYRKILNELSSAESPTITSDVNKDVDDDDGGGGGNGEEDDEDEDSESARTDGESTNTITVSGVTVVPAGSIQLSSQGEGIQGLQTLTMTNAGAAGQIVQYAQGSDGQFFVPVTVSAADLRAYQIAGAGGTATAIQQGVVVTAPASNIQSPQQMAEEASRKRELRLLKNRCKNREAARECRRKKKEYIKCLENRVAVLENQNKALIEELKALKELYCSKTD